MLRFLTTAAVAALSTIATAQEDAKTSSLSIGDKAPKPVVAKVIKGDFPEKFEDGKVYVMEFWATWCGPCRDSMPHISKLQQEYKDRDVQMVGVAIWERQQTQEERNKKVADFLSSGDWPQKTQYTLAVDDDQKTANAYMRASGQGGIPTAFIVGKTGEVEWIGHPMGMDEPLAQVVAGNWDRAAAKEAFDKERAVEEEARAFEKETQELQQQMMEAYGKQDWDGMVKIMNEIKAKAPPAIVTQIEMNQFMILLTMANQPERAYKIGAEIVAQHGDDPAVMNGLAWTIATDPRIQTRDFDLALKAARAGVKATDGKDANILDTLATVLWEKGDKQEAIKTEEKAIELSNNEDAKAEFKAKLSEWKRDVSSTG